jgi:hypothetical protein
MAQWAMEMAIAAIASAFFTFGGLILIWRTLIVGDRTLIATQNMAVDQKRIGEAQVRAYIGVPEVKLRWGKGMQMIEAVEFIIENFGQSPAMQVKIDTSISVVDPSGHQSTMKPEEFYSKIRAEKVAQVSGSIESGGSRKTIVMSEGIQNPRYIEGWERGEIDIFGYVSVCYIDVFRRDQFLEYCVRFVFEKTDTTKWTHFESYAPLNNSS